MDYFFLLEENIDFVRINFENCEQIKIPVQHIINLSLGNLNNDGEYISANSLNLILNPDANIRHTYEPCLTYKSNITIFQRILHRSDIVSIDIHKATEENLELLVPYKENEKGFNDAEHCYIGKNGELHIEIKEANGTR